MRAADGSRISSRENIGSYVVAHFSSLFTSTNPILENNLSNLVHEVIYFDDNVALYLIPEEAEFFLAISVLGLNKIPNLDGMRRLFYKTY